MCEIKKGKYYKSKNNSNIIVQATESVADGNSFDGILVEDPNDEYPSDLNRVTSGWISISFNECNYEAATTSNDLFPIY